MVYLLCIVITAFLLYSFFDKNFFPALSLLFLLIICSSNSFCKVSPGIENIKIVADTVKKTALPDSIISITNLGSQKDSAKINEILEIKIRTVKPIASFNTLYVNDIKVKGLKPWEMHDYDKTVFFKLEPKLQNLVVQFLESQSIDKVEIPVYFGLGDDSRVLAKSIKPIQLEVKQKISEVWVYIMFALLAILLYVGLTRNILKDDNNLYYSLGRTQLLYWTFIFSISYLFISKQTGTLPDISASILTIMGISVASTAASKVIENNNKSVVPIDPEAKSEGFFLDILSDGSSINIQRFQNVVFNLLFGIIFIQKAISSNLMPDFDNNVLLMLGISAGAYAGLKITEATKEQNKPAAQVNSDDSTVGTTTGNASAEATGGTAGTGDKK